MNNLKVTLGTVPDNCVEEQAVEISEFSITYCQPADANSRKEDYQFLKITAQQNGSGEDGWYCDIETPDCHWSISNPNDIAALVEDFNSRMQLNIVKENDLKTYEIRRTTSE